MKKLLGISAITVLAVTLGFGQSASRPAAADANQAGAPTAATNNDSDQHHDWGWIGLLGLGGLAGFAGRRREREGTGRGRGEINEVRRAA
jgi:MYXO-CTERM domain-containing protein